MRRCRSSAMRAGSIAATAAPTPSTRGRCSRSARRGGSRRKRPAPLVVRASVLVLDGGQAGDRARAVADATHRPRLRSAEVEAVETGTEAPLLGAGDPADVVRAGDVEA